MNSSGIKRGLAASAIAALAITGIPAIANATPLVTQETLATSTVGVTLQGLENNDTVSVAGDGTNSTISLVATGGSAVEYVTFSYGATKIATVARSTSGDFQTEWTPPVGLANTTITATRTDAAGAVPAVAPLNDPFSVDQATNVTISGTAPSLEITKKDELGYFVQPGATPETAAAAGNYFTEDGTVAGIVGTTSVGGAAISLDNGYGLVGGPYSTGALPALAPGQTSQAFGAKVELNQGLIAASAVDTDQIEVVGSTVTPVRDAQGFNLYSQTISGITATAAPLDGTTNTTTITVKVTDQKGQPVAGAHVSGTGTALAAPVDAFTNAAGVVTVANAKPGSANFVVDRTNVPGFTNGFDYQTDITVGTAAPTTITFDSQDGLAFDFDEYAAGNTRVLVKDAAGNALSGQTFFYTQAYTPFVPVAVTNVAKTFTGSVVTDAQGYATIPLNSDATTQGLANGGTGGTIVLNGYVNRGTPPGQDAGDLALAATTYKVGESTVKFDGPAATDRQSGTEQTFTGTVTLADGTVLAGRTLNISYAPAANSALSATQPAGTTRLSNTTATVVTSATGTFSVAVTDPSATPQVDENGNVLTATGTATVGTAPNVKEGIGTDANAALTVNFKADAAPKNITLTPVFDTGFAPGNGDAYDELFGGTPTPGRPVSFEINLSNSNSVALAGQQVTLKTDHGFFTPNQVNTSGDPSKLTPDPAPAEGGLYGEWKSLGDTITVTTDAAGKAIVTVAIEKDAGFDDDGLVTANVTATAGTASNASPIAVTFSTVAESLNPSTVEISPAATQPATVELPDVRSGLQVRYNVFAKDQFGNLVADSVVVSDNTNDAGFVGEAANGTLAVTSQFTSSAPAVTAQATSTTVNTSQTPKATWTQASNKYTDGNAAVAGFQPAVATVANNSVTDTADAAINWYAIDFAASTFTITTDPETEVPVGAPVLETVKVLDQKGKPVAGLTVRFIRQGPGDTTDGDPNNPITGVTNANGEAFYAFTGTTPGVARISVVVTDGTQIKTLTDEVTIVAADSGDPVAISATIAGNDNGAKADRLRVTTDIAAAGTTVQFYRVKKNGNSAKVGDPVIVAADGSASIVVSDVNKRRKSKYYAIVAEGPNTLEARTNNIRVR